MPFSKQLSGTNMKRIKKDELYQHIGRFLKTKGIQLTDGSYAKSIQAGCSLLADAINISQSGFERAKSGLDRKVSEVRQVIHEKTAPQKTTTGQTGVPPIIVTEKPSAAKTNHVRSRRAKAVKPRGAKGQGKKPAK